MTTSLSPLAPGLLAPGPHAAPLDLVEALSARGDRLVALMAEAARVRDEGLERAGRPRTITWSRKVFVPLTTLCRDRCHYCTFVDTPAKLERKGLPPFLDADRAVAIARQGAALGCKEALLTLGDRPEDRWDVARTWLADHGFSSTLDYVGHVARRITEETGLLAHLNPGVMTADELARLRPTAPSMGMMLETTSHRLFAEPGQAHFGSPDKDPAVRLRTLRDAGDLRIPFTTGLLVGIGETLQERAETIVALRELGETYGHLQEVIVQNFRAKPATAMQAEDDADTESYLAAVATTRLVLGPDARVQAPPNLSDPAELSRLVGAGIDDWGGVSPLTADHVNPERPWPHLADLDRATAASGHVLRERLTVHPRFIADRDVWIDAGLHERVVAMADDDGLAAHPGEPDADAAPRRPLLPVLSAPSVDHLLDRAAAEPTSLTEHDLTRLLDLDGDALVRLQRVADELRRTAVGATTTLVVNRNLDSSQVHDPDVVAAVAADAWELGASELCVQGTASADAPADVYERIARAVKAAAPGLHLHAFRPADVVDGARRTGRDLRGQLLALRSAGVDTVPGTGVKLLDEDHRARHFPDDVPVATWVESITAAHGVGLRSTSVLFYGHGETSAQRARHLLALRSLQDRTGGFTELVPMAMPAATVRDHRAVHAVARIALHGRVPHVQAAWTRLGVELAVDVLRGGADDLGGVLLDGRVRPEAGVEHGRELPVEQARALARSLGRHLRLRSTTYGEHRPPGTTPARSLGAASGPRGDA